jgi:hypothetical protein
LVGSISPEIVCFFFIFFVICIFGTLEIFWGWFGSPFFWSVFLHSSLSDPSPASPAPGAVYFDSSSSSSLSSCEFLSSAASFSISIYSATTWLPMFSDWERPCSISSKSESESFFFGFYNFLSSHSFVPISGGATMVESFWVTELSCSSLWILSLSWFIISLSLPVFSCWL